MEAETHKDPSWQGPCFLAGSKKDGSLGTRESSQPRALAEVFEQVGQSDEAARSRLPEEIAFRLAAQRRETGPGARWLGRGPVAASRARLRLPVLPPSDGVGAPWRQGRRRAGSWGPPGWEQGLTGGLMPAPGSGREPCPAKLWARAPESTPALGSQWSWDKAVGEGARGSSLNQDQPQACRGASGEPVLGQVGP